MGFGSRNCGYCSGIGTIRKTISNNLLTCMCHVCKERYTLSLLKIQKKVIYLDQNFFSHAYRKKPLEFLRRFDRLCDLAKKQLLICPYSDVHDKETHLFAEWKELWEFIKNVSRGRRFYLQSKIKNQQLINVYVSFIRNGSVKPKMDLFEAIEPSIHNWDESLRIEVDWSITNFVKLSLLRQAKEKIAGEIIDILPLWRESKSSLKDDYNLEIADYGHILLGTFLDLTMRQDIEKMLESESYRIVRTFLDLEMGGNDIEQKFDSVKKFLVSDHFSNVPHVNISAGLWAMLKDKIKKNQFLPEQIKKEDIIRQVRGIPADIEHLSIFAPYCEAVFTEKTMARWLREWKKHPLGGFTFKVFSADNWAEFDAYLDEIENNTTSEMKEELEIVYGG